MAERPDIEVFEAGVYPRRPSNDHTDRFIPKRYDNADIVGDLAVYFRPDEYNGALYTVARSLTQYQMKDRTAYYLKLGYEVQLRYWSRHWVYMRLV